jgi:tRNA U34 5-methylaminomethyl-2-thiouridine-forming methyltransferase MnmC
MDNPNERGSDVAVCLFDLPRLGPQTVAQSNAILLRRGQAEVGFAEHRLLH